MAGIIFFRSKKYKEVVDFYKNAVGMSIWLVQGGCTILQKGNLLIGFCDREEADTSGMVTLFFEKSEDVDRYYSVFKGNAEDKPKENPRFGIYHFFTKDPEGRAVEFQSFLYPVKPYHSGSELLIRRRSIRRFKQTNVSDEVLRAVFEPCRYVPTSCNSQTYKYILIRDPEILKQLSETRGGSSSPIGRAPIAVAVITDPAATKRPVQDGAAASTYLLLSAAQCGLGTCWIGGVDSAEVKDILNLDNSIHVSMITPLGWPEEGNTVPERRRVDDFVIGL